MPKDHSVKNPLVFHRLIGVFGSGLCYLAELDGIHHGVRPIWHIGNDRQANGLTLNGHYSYYRLNWRTVSSLLLANSPGKATAYAALPRKDKLFNPRLPSSIPCFIIRLHSCQRSAIGLCDPTSVSWSNICPTNYIF